MMEDELISFPDWWDEKRAQVMCKFCAELRDFLKPPGSTGGRSQLHSSLSAALSLTFRLPKEYEIDKVEKRFVAPGANSPPSEPAGLTNLTEKLDGLGLDDRRPSWGGALEEAKRELLYGNCIHLKTSDYAQLFLRGVDDDGNTALKLATIRGNDSVVRLSLEHGAHVNERDKRGRTPLMWAALFGRYHTVELLLQKNAKKNLTEDDGLKLKAIDLAASSDRLEAERQRHPHYEVFTEEASEARKIITHYLLADKLQETEVKMPTKTENLEKCSFKMVDAHRVRLIGPVGKFQQKRGWKNGYGTEKALGILIRGGNYPPIATKSGWGSSDPLNTDMQILPSTINWTTEAVNVAKAIGFTFTPSDVDEGIPGKYHASHVEAQLIAFFINKHVFLPSEIREGDGLHGLAKATPVSGMLKHATIIVNKDVCGDCERFKNKVNDVVLGLEILLVRRLRSN